MQGRPTSREGSAMSRRSFIAATAGASAGLALSRPRQLFASEGPQKGGHFRLGMIEGETTDSWDPRLTGTTYMVHVNFQTRNCLVEIGPGMRLEPELAEVIEPRSGGSKWAFKLRKGVQFHNGKSLTPADVIYSINLHRSADTKSGAKALLKSVRDVATEGSDAVVFTLDAANVDFPYILADYHFVIVPDGTQNFSEGMGTGGYVLEDFRPGVSTRVRRNPNYWKQNRAWFDSIDTINITDGSARNSALLAGSVDAIVQTDPLTADLLAKKSGFQLIEVTGTQHVTLPMDTQLAPFNNNDVRLALKHSVDRNRLVKTLLRGHGVAASDHPIAPVDRYYASDLAPTPYDPDKARFYLKKAGLSSLALNLDCSDAVLSFGVDLASLYQ
jgi:peptide/nickel transport system substrate-binding protein